MNRRPAQPSAEAVRAIHAEVLARFGGTPGVRDAALLEAAILAPQSTTNGEPLFPDTFEAAAAYLFYLLRHRPFAAGDRRTALATCLVFLAENGLLPEETLEVTGWEQLVRDVATGQIDRDQTTGRLRQLLGALG